MLFEKHTPHYSLLLVALDGTHCCYDKPTARNSIGLL